MALSVTDKTNDLTYTVNNDYKRAFLERMLPVCPYLLGSEPGELMKNGSTATCKWRRIESIAASTSSLSEVTTASYMQGHTPVELTKTDPTATVAKYGQFVILNEEVVDFDASPVVMDTMENLGEAAGRSVSKLQESVLTGGLSVRYGGGVASAGLVDTKVSADDIKFVLNTLKRNNAKTFTPMSAGSDRYGSTGLLKSFIAIHHPDVTPDIEALTGYQSVDKYAAHVQTMDDEHGYLSANGVGIRFIQTSDATIDTGAGDVGTSDDVRTTTNDTDIYNITILGRGCHGTVGFGQRFRDGSYRPDGGKMSGIDIIAKPMGSGGTSDPFNEIMTIAYKFWHAGVVLNSNVGYNIAVGAQDLS